MKFSPDFGPLGSNQHSQKISSIEKDPVLNTGNGRMVNVNRSKMALNTDDSDLPSVIRPTVVRPSGNFDIFY